MASPCSQHQMPTFLVLRPSGPRLSSLTLCHLLFWRRRLTLTEETAGSMGWLPCSLRALRYLKPAWTSPFPLPAFPQSLQSPHINSSRLFSEGFPHRSLLGFQGPGHWRVQTLDQCCYLSGKLPPQEKRLLPGPNCCFTGLSGEPGGIIKARQAS